MSAPEINTGHSVAVVGAGVVGLCSALELLRAGFHVTLLDRDQPAKQTSFGNAAYLAAEYIEPLASMAHIREALSLAFSERAAFKVTPDHWPAFIPWAMRFLREARPARVQHNREAMSRLNRQAIPAWRELLAFANASDQLHESGFLELWEDPARLSHTREAGIEAGRQGFDTQLLVGDQLREHEPALTERIHHALYYPTSCHLGDTYATCMRLFGCFEEHEGQFITAGVESVLPQRSGATLVMQGEQLHFDQVVIAAGAWSGGLLERLGLKVPLAAERGYHLTLPGEQSRTRHILASGDRHVVLSPLDCGLRIVGFGEYGNLGSPPVEKRYRQLEHHLGKLIRNIDSKGAEVQTWMGIRPTLPDSLPVIDLHPEYPQVGFVFGHHHLGVTQAAISAKMIAALMRDGEVKKALPDAGNAYAVTRFNGY